MAAEQTQTGFGLREVSVIGAFATTAVLASTGTVAQAVFAAGVLALGVYGFSKQSEPATRGKPVPAVAYFEEPIPHPSFMP